MAEQRHTYLINCLVCMSSGRISRSGSKVKVIGRRSGSPGENVFCGEVTEEDNTH